MKWTLPSVLQLVDRQIAAWSSQLQAQEERGKAEGITWPLILVSREFGALGEKMARSLGERTEFSVWDRELVEAMAKEEGISERLLESLDETTVSAIDDAISGALMGAACMKSEYLRALMSVVHTIATHGGGIIVGRGARYILEPKDVLSVRVVSPLENRVRGYAERMNISDRESREMVTTKDRERDNFIRHHFKRERSNMSDYDLVVNTGTFSLEKCTELVATAYEAKFGRDLPKP